MVLEIRGRDLYNLLYQSNSFIRHISRCKGRRLLKIVEVRCVKCRRLVLVEENFFIVGA